MVSLFNLSVCLSVLPLDLGRPRARVGAAASTGAGAPSSCALYPLTNSGPFPGHEWLTYKKKTKQKNKQKNKTDQYSSIGEFLGAGALNQGNILPSLPWTPLHLRAPSGPPPPLLV